MDKRQGKPQTPGTLPNTFGLPEPTKTPPAITAAGLLQGLQVHPSMREFLLHGPPLQRQPPSAAVQAMIDDLLPQKEHTEQVITQAAAQLQEKENRWFTEYLVQQLNEAGYPVTAATLPTYGPRLSLRRYPDGVLVVAIDAEGGKLGRVLFGVGPSEVNFPLMQEGAGLVLTRPILSAARAIAYEISGRLNPRPLDSAPNWENESRM